jgi:hypothetical protein
MLVKKSTTANRQMRALLKKRRRGLLVFTMRFCVCPKASSTPSGMSPLYCDDVSSEERFVFPLRLCRAVFFCGYSYLGLSFACSPRKSINAAWILSCLVLVPVLERFARSGTIYSPSDDADRP